jgi:hypothetical protein
LIRERVFTKLAEIMEVDYDYIYYQWLLGAWHLVTPQKVF